VYFRAHPKLRRISANASIKLAAVMVILGFSSQPGLASAWRYSAAIDPLTDEQVSRAWMESTGAVINARCRAGIVELYIAKSLYIAGELVPVRYRIDKQPMVEEIWGPSTSGTGVFAPDAAATARALRSGRSLLVEVSDFRGTPSRLSVSLTGAATTLAKVLSDCGISVIDPRAQDATIWRRVVDELDGRSRKDVILVQKALNVLSASKVNEQGIRDLATYQTASRIYETYWEDCAANRIDGGQCRFWRTLKVYGNEPRYPGSMVDVLTDRIKALNDPRFAAYIPPPDRSKPLPRGHSEAWITSDDYPSSLLRKKMRGTTTVGMRVAADGRVESCAVQSSSGSTELDETTCRLLMRRARYQPALDKDGNGVAMPVQYSMNWKLPE
jgi:TonB family protein